MCWLEANLYDLPETTHFRGAPGTGGVEVGAVLGFG